MALEKRQVCARAKEEVSLDLEAGEALEEAPVVPESEWVGDHWRKAPRVRIQHLNDRPSEILLIFQRNHKIRD